MYPGELVTDHLRLVRLLGQGGMGSVWVADHLKLETQVAVKFVSWELLDHGQVRARFQREATSAAKIHSPHVVRVFDHGETNSGIPFIAMELLAGQDLGAIIEERGPLPPPFVRVVLAQACKGLANAHALGIVHRDIKPENIFVSDEGGEPFVRLLDFGVAKQTLSNDLGFTASGTMMGTPYYMSPEQAMSAKQVDFRSDLWSLGVVTYHALTGQRPFDAETLGALCVKLNEGQFDPVTRLRPDLLPSIDKWFERALARQPEDRFGSAKEMADAFALATGASISSRVSSFAARSEPAPVPAQTSEPMDTIAQAASVLRRSRARRSSAVVATTIGMLLLAGLAVAGFWLRMARTPSVSQTVQPPSGAAGATPSQPEPSSSAASVTSAPIAIPAVSLVPSENASSVPSPAPVQPPGTNPGMKLPSVAPGKGKSTGPASHQDANSNGSPAAARSATPNDASGNRPTKKDRGF